MSSNIIPFGPGAGSTSASKSEDDCAPDGLRDHVAAMHVLSRGELKTDLPRLLALGIKFQAERTAYNTTFHQMLVRTYHDGLERHKQGTVEKFKVEMRKAYELRPYSGGSVFSLVLHCEGQLDGPFASEMGEVLRAALHKGRSVEELQKEITAPGWDPRKARNEAREFLAATGLSATKRRENRKQKEAAASVEAQKADSPSTDEQESVEQAAYDSSHEGTGDSTFSEKACGSSTEATGVEKSAPAGKPTRNASVRHSSERQTLGVMEFDDARKRQVFCPLPPAEAIRVALDLMWSAKGFKTRGHSPEVTAIIEALIRLIHRSFEHTKGSVR